MRIVYMGTPEIAATVLTEIITSGKHQVLAAVTQPDKPKGRGMEMVFSDVKKEALKYGIPVFQPEKASDPAFIEEIKALNPDIIVVTAYGKILKPALLAIPKYGCINVHASLLPKYRGASPIQWAVINGETESGVTIMYMAEGLDTGDMILQKELRLDSKETAGSLHDRLAALGGPAVLEAMDMIEEGIAPRIPQEEALANYVTTIDKSFGKVNFSEDALRIERLIRGLNPWPGTFTYIDGKMLKLWDAEVLADYKCPKDKANIPGVVVEVNKDSFVVLCGTGALKVLKVQLEGKKQMDAADFLRGFKMETGIILGE